MTGRWWNYIPQRPQKTVSSSKTGTAGCADSLTRRSWKCAPTLIPRSLHGCSRRTRFSHPKTTGRFATLAESPMAQELARRAFVRSARPGRPAKAVSSFAQAATWTSDTALLIQEFQVGIGDQPYARRAARRAAAALQAGRAGGLLAAFSEMQF